MIGYAIVLWQQAHFLDEKSGKNAERGTNATVTRADIRASRGQGSSSEVVFVGTLWNSLLRTQANPRSGDGKSV